MKTKLELAHEWAIEMLRTGDSSDDVVSCAWRYADAMQAEADKRAKQNKDEFYANLSDPMKKVREQEWQPDWSQAPKEYPTVTGWYLFRNKAHWICDDVPCGPAPTFGLTGNHIVERRTI